VSRRRLLIAGSLVVIAVGIAIGIYAHEKSQPESKRGSASDEFVTTDQPKPRPRRAERRVPWPTYGFDAQRTHVADFKHRPPYHRRWQIDAHDTLEFPPSVGYGRVFVPQQKGLFFALTANGGHLKWRKNTHRCSASSPAVGRGMVFQAWMAPVPCPQDQAGAKGFVIAWDAKTGHKRWKFKTAPVESSPLLVKRTLYFGTWSHKVYAISARTGRKRWSFEADDQVNTSAAYSKGTIYIASDGGTLYALSARTGKLRWSAQSHGGLGGREFFYATPTVAYGRVYIGNTDGTMYVFGAKTGRLKWARPLGTYIYSGAAVWKQRVFVGTYDGSFYALDAATGDVRWRRETPGAVHGAPTVMDGLVYYSTCSTCGSQASRTVKHGPDGTYARDARTGKFRWSFPAGKYANPVVADRAHIFVVGRSNLFALEQKRAYEKRKKARAARRAKKRRAKKKKS
jgi:outer membrane protein assembly factor BamB